MSIYVYTDEFNMTGKVKKVVKSLMGKNFGGPKTVAESFIDGCQKLNLAIFVNAKRPIIGSSAIVLNGISSLKWVLKQKQTGIFNKVIAGPNIFLNPLDHQGLAQSSLINNHIVPAEWVKRTWQKIDSDMNNIVVVPAGVKDMGSLVNPEGFVMVYVKYAPKSLLEYVVKYLVYCGRRYQIVEYGSYSNTDYSRFLASSSSAIFLSPSESQGLALHEVWMADIPTLIWSPGLLTLNWVEVEDTLISCPYYDPKCGEIFSGESDFALKADKFFGNLAIYNPRQYSLENFTVTKTAKHILDMLN